MGYKLFKDALIQKCFEEDGYAVINLADEEKIKALKEFYSGIHHAPMPGHGFQVSLDNQDPDFVQMVSAELIRTIGPAVNKHFTEHRIFTASFVVKDRNPMGIVPPHQDWTFVDESQYWSATIWCPLVDVNADNGALGLVRGSHLFYDHIRPSPSPQYEPPFKNQIQSILPYLRIVELKAGQAIVFNNRTLHSSPPNLSGQPRISFGIGITHKDAMIRHYYKLPGGDQDLMEGYEVGPEFFLRYNNARLSLLYEKGEKPRDLNSIGIFRYAYKSYTTEELIKAMENSGNIKDDSLPGKMGFPQDDGHTAVPKAYPQNSKGQADSSPAKKLSFWKVYTPANVLREIKYRLTKK